MLLLQTKYKYDKMMLAGPVFFIYGRSAMSAGTVRP